MPTAGELGVEDVLDVLQATFNLTGEVRGKRDDREFRILCPDPGHKDARPSCDINLRSGFWHCLAGETEVITEQGVFAIKELTGETHRLLTMDELSQHWGRHRGKWVEAPIVAFGTQRLKTLTLSRNGRRKTLRATAEHRWPTQRRGTVTTDRLRPGDRLMPVLPPTRIKRTHVSSWGVVHGLVYGDGYRDGAKTTSVTLWGDKNIELLHHFPHPTTDQMVTPGGVPGIRVRGLPRHLKDRPDLHESPGYLLGFLAGWFAADGCYSHAPALSTASKEEAEFFRTLCTYLGIGTYGIQAQDRRGIDGRMSMIYSVCLMRSTVPEEFWLMSDHQGRAPVIERPGWTVVSVEETDTWEEVYCAVVPETHTFALADNLLTGNCWSCGKGGDLVELGKVVTGMDASGVEQAIRPGTMEALTAILAARLSKLRINTMPPELREPLTLPGPYHSGPLDEMLDRGFTDNTLRRWGVRFCKQQELQGGKGLFTIYRSIAVPIRDERQKLLAWCYRRTELSPAWQPKYVYTPEAPIREIWFGLQHHAHADEVAVVEGTTDAMALDQMGFPALGMLGGSMPDDKILTLQRFKRIVIFADRDDAGAHMTMKIGRLLGNRMPIYVVRYSSWMPGNDPASMNPVDVEIAWERALPWAKFKMGLQATQ